MSDLCFRNITLITVKNLLENNKNKGQKSRWDAAVAVKKNSVSMYIRDLAVGQVSPPPLLVIS